MEENKRLNSNKIMNRINKHSSTKQYAKKYRDFVGGHLSTAIPDELNTIGSDEFINYGEITRDRKLGYMFGHPFRITHNENERVQALLEEVEAHNDFSHLSTETGREMMEIGRASCRERV